MGIETMVSLSPRMMETIQESLLRPSPMCHGQKRSKEVKKVHALVKNYLNKLGSELASSFEN